MVSQLRKEILNRFGIPSVVVCLVQGSDHFMEDRLRERYHGELDETLKFIDTSLNLIPINKIQTQFQS